MKKAKIFVPRKIKGGSSIGKEGEVWYAIRCSSFSAPEHRAFKKYLGDACKEFFLEDEDSSESEEKNV